MNQIGFQAVKQTSTTKTNKLGERAVTPDGREWVYVNADSALAKGSVAVPVAQVQAETVSLPLRSSHQVFTHAWAMQGAPDSGDCPGLFILERLGAWALVAQSAL
jgi:hypothetical protein